MKVRQNQIMIIQAYRYGGTWVFDDEDTDLEKEAFVSGAPEMIDAYLVERFKDTHYDRDIKLLFSAQPFPGACLAKQVNNTPKDDYTEPQVASYDDALSILDDESIERVPVDWCDHPLNTGDGTDNEGFIWGIEYWDGQDVLDVIWYDDIDERDYDLKDQSTDDWENFTWDDTNATASSNWVNQWATSLNKGWYETTIAGKKMQGWLCPATLLYFADYPDEIWYSAEPLSEEDSKKAQATRKVRDDIEDAKWEKWRANNPASRQGTLSRTLSERYNVGSNVPGWEPLGASYTPADSPLVNDDGEE
tara:strand:+ start:6425 stop:7339 length:915 start_codon:yes stop_codon:yes gene_type:complete